MEKFHLPPHPKSIPNPPPIFPRTPCPAMISVALSATFLYSDGLPQMPLVVR